MKDKGLFIFALILLGLGGVVLSKHETAISHQHSSHVTPITGTAADIVGICLIIGGLYFVFQSTK